jgi:GT2 family glycosyltransferase
MVEEHVCAIILDYFGADKTKQSLLSLTGQGLRTVYVLDNSGSESATAELHRAVAHVRTVDPGFGIKILSSGENLGFGRGVNYVLDHDRRCQSPHDFYLLLNNDAIAGPGLVRGLLLALKNDPEAVLVAPRVVSSEPGREYGVWYHRYLGLLLSRPGKFCFHYFTGCCLLFPRHLISEAGLFDEAFFMYGEDTELGWRLNRQGKKMICVTDVFVEHEYGPSVDRSSFFYEYHMARGHLLLSLKTSLHPIELPFLTVLKYVTLFCRAGTRSLRHRTLMPFAGLLMALLPSQLAELRVLPRHTTS